MPSLKATVPKSSSVFSGMAMPLAFTCMASKVPKIRNRAMTMTCRKTLTMRFLADSLAFLQARLRCIRSWSRPVVAMTMKMPAMNCFQK